MYVICKTLTANLKLIDKLVVSPDTKIKYQYVLPFMYVICKTLTANLKLIDKLVVSPDTKLNTTMFYLLCTLYVKH